MLVSAFQTISVFWKRALYFLSTVRSDFALISGIFSRIGSLRKEVAQKSQVRRKSKLDNSNPFLYIFVIGLFALLLFVEIRELS